MSEGPVAAALVIAVSGAFHTYLQNPNIFYTIQYYSSLEIIQDYSREKMMPYVAVLNTCASS